MGNINGKKGTKIRLVIALTLTILATGVYLVDNSRHGVEENKETEIYDKTVEKEGVEVEKRANTLDLSGYSDKKVALVFWSMDCPPCVEELPIIQELGNELEDEIDFLAINLDQDEEQVKKYMEDNKYTFGLLLDTDRKIYEEYEIESIPTIIVYSKDKKTNETHVGKISKEDINSIIENID